MDLKFMESQEPIQNKHKKRPIQLRIGPFLLYICVLQSKKLDYSAAATGSATTSVA